MRDQLDEDAFLLSDKVKVLVKMLEKSHTDNNDVKTIIFVKDRSVAVYLKKLLHGGEDDSSSSSSQFGDSNEDPSAANRSTDTNFLPGILDQRKFRIGFAMGFKSKNIVNRAYKSLNTEKMSLYEDVLGQLPSIRTIKLS